MSNPEFPFPPEQPEIDWSPHSLDDDCPWNEFRLEVEHKRPNRKRKRELHGILEDFIKTGGTPEKTLMEGEFSLQAHNIGTIIRLDRDEFNTYSAFHGNRKYWGIIDETKGAQNKPVRILIYFHELRYPINKSILAPEFLARTTTQNIDIGIVFHEKLDKGSIKAQMFERTNWVEVWQFGQGVRETAKEKGIVGKLFPERTTI